MLFAIAILIFQLIEEAIGVIGATDSILNGINLRVIPLDVSILNFFEFLSNLNSQLLKLTNNVIGTILYLVSRLISLEKKHNR